MSTPPNKSASGFTFIELIFSVGLLFIVFGLTTGFYIRFFTQNAVENTQRQLGASLRKAQMYAMMGKQNSNWGVNITSQKIILFQGNSYASRTTVFDEVYAVNNNITISGFTEVVYARITGLPSSAPTVTISGANEVKTVAVNAQGVVSK